jgi:glycosyltransferase involved in cell wall biosynthesis
MLQDTGPSMNQVLLITYYFPPLGGAGVQRTLKFAKYLRDFGWNPTVLTVHPPRGRLLDSTLLEDIPADIRVIHTPAPALPLWLPWKFRNLISRWLLMVDDQIGWLPFAARRGREILRSTQIDLVFSSSAPYTSHLVASQLVNFSKLPWIADFQDPWIGNFSSTYPTRLHKRFAGRLEHTVVTKADRTLVVSDPMRAALLNRYPGLQERKVITLPNGYDPADFLHLHPRLERNSRFIISYTGSFYAKAITPSNFLAGLKLCLDNQRIPRDKVMINIVGNVSSKIEDYVKQLNLVDIIHFTGYVPHRTSITYLLESDVLLLIIGNLPGSQAVFTSKIFEYLASKKPVLALAPPGAAADLIREAQAGEVVSPDDIDEIAKCLYSYYKRWESGSLMIDSRSGIIQRFDRRLLTQSLASIMDDLV